MAKAARLDIEMVRRGMVSSRAEAGRVIKAGRVMIKGMPAARASTLVLPSDPIVVTGEPSRFLSRGGEKLRGALDRFDVDPSGKRWLDAGASTGGFTDCLLQAGAAAVVAADVGYGQLHWRLRSDPRVIVLDRVNLRHLRAEQLPWSPQGIVADLSFISLGTVLPALVATLAGRGDVIPLVKPQFEAGREAVGKRGVVVDPEIRRAALSKVAAQAEECGLAVVDACASPLKGPSGNVEYFLHCRKGPPPGVDRAVIEAAATEGEAL